jgi:hypothetical protein
MLDTSTICLLLILVGGYKKAYKLTAALISFAIITDLFRSIDNDIIYNTVSIISIAIFARYVKGKIIKLGFLILVIYFLVAFGLSVNHIREYSDSTWETVTLWSSLYVYVYYATISLIFIGLIIGGKGGRRIGSTGSNMFHSDYRSINYQRIRSKFN